MNKKLLTIAICAVATASAVAVELPICEELASEAAYCSVSEADSTAIVINRGDANGQSVELYAHGRKSYFEVSLNGDIYANNGRRYHVNRVASLRDSSDWSFDQYMSDIWSLVTDL